MRWKGEEFQRVALWQQLIKNDFGANVLYYDSKDQDQWAGAFLTAANKVKP